MGHNKSRGTLLKIPLIEESYGHSILISIGIHGIVALLIIIGGYLLLSPTIQIGGGVGGGIGDDVFTVGVVEEFSGGAGMVKPGLVPKPPALLDKPHQDRSEAIPLPGTVEPKEKRPSAKDSANAKKAIAKSNIIPVPAQPGSGGVARLNGGSDGGIGGGIGVSIGAGEGGLGESYVRRVEIRISSAWMRPPEGIRVEIIYSFYVKSDGSISDIKQEKSSGNAVLDLNVERAINALKFPPLPPPPPEFRNRPIKFVAQFIYPPN
jgi:TonB family protein